MRDSTKCPWIDPASLAGDQPVVESFWTVESGKGVPQLLDRVWSHVSGSHILISSIHARGVPVPDAARRIAALAAKMMTLASSGVAVKEDGSSPDLPTRLPPV